MINRYTPFKGAAMYGLHGNEKIYRCISLGQFVWIIETYQTYLTRIQDWEDPYEAPIDIINEIYSEYCDAIYPISSDACSLFGQCWSLVSESDAIWRIYSPDKQGLVIESTVFDIATIPGIKQGLIAPVIYYDSLYDGFKNILAAGYPLPYGFALLKRKAFEHEKEVRLVVLNDSNCLDNPTKHQDCKHIYLGLNPKKFINNIIIDPRASDWYVETVQEYCENAGLSIIPYKSLLYSEPITDPSLLLQFKNESA